MNCERLPEPRTQLRLWQHCVLFLAACALVVSRQPDAVFHAQFYAEGGHVFFADAYNLGWWRALFMAHTGYYQTMQRLSASVALLFPLSLAPLVINCIAVSFQALPVNLLLSSRASAWGSLRFRALLAAMYLVVPNAWEVTCRIPDTQFLLCLSALILLVVPTACSRAARVFDLCILLLSGLSGPFCMPLLLIALYLAFNDRDRWRWVRAGTLAVTVLAQVWALLVVDPHGHANRALGASSSLLMRIFGGQIVSTAFLGANSISQMPGAVPLIFLTCLALAGTALVVICFVGSPRPMRLFLLFTAMLLLASLLSPSGAVPDSVSSWQRLATPGSGIRYWFMPTIALAWSLIWGVQQPRPILKGISAGLLFVMCFGIAREWRHHPAADQHFAENVSRFEAAPAGATIVIPIDPPGWNMTLVKHPAK